MSILDGWQGYAASAVLAGLLAGVGTGYVVHRMDESRLADVQRAQAVAAQRATAKALTQQQIIDQHNAAAAKAEATAQQRIVTVTRTITKEVPVYVHDQVLCHDGVPVGLLRVLVAAERGADPASLRLPAGVTDDTCAALAPSALAAALAADFGDANANGEQLNALEAAVRANDAVTAGKPVGR